MSLSRSRCGSALPRRPLPSLLWQCWSVCRVIGGDRCWPLLYCSLVFRSLRDHQSVDVVCVCLFVLFVVSLVSARHG